jgi:hypothetical protein
MFYTHSTFIGIDPTAGHKPFGYAALDSELRLLALGQGSLDEVLAFVGGQSQAYVAVCAPSRPNQGVMDQAERRAQLNPPPRPGRWTNFRLAEYLLRQHNISIPRTEANESDCAHWMQMGFTLYRRLESQGYRPYPTAEATRQWLEVYPHATFCALLGLIPLPKNTLEGRIQRQLALYDCKLHIPDAMDIFEEITRHRLLQGVLPLDDLYSPAELDALSAAYTAWLAAAHSNQVCAVGDPAEGQIIIPVAELKPHY